MNIGVVVRVKFKKVRTLWVNGLEYNYSFNNEDYIGCNG